MGTAQSTRRAHHRSRRPRSFFPGRRRSRTSPPRRARSTRAPCKSGRPRGRWSRRTKISYDQPSTKSCRAFPPRSRCPVSRRKRAHHPADRRQALHLREDRRSPHPAHLQQDRCVHTSRRRALGHAARRSPIGGRGRQTGSNADISDPSANQGEIRFIYFRALGLRRLREDEPGALPATTNLCAMPNKSRNIPGLTRDRRTKTPV